jgi:DNA-directed RNA polymerase omega subunit
LDIVNVDLETLYNKTGSIYKLVVMATMRAIEINAGAAQLAQHQQGNSITLALREIAEGRVSFKARKE